jgi:hypothetical protein
MSAPGKSFSFVSDRGYSPVNLRYNRESEWFFASLEDCILRGSSPIEIVKNRVANFQEESLEVEFYLDVKDDHGGFGHEYDRKNFPQRKEVLDEIISRAVAELNKDEGYRDFQRELADLRRKAASLSGRLGKYVGEYVSIVNI